MEEIRKYKAGITTGILCIFISGAVYALNGYVKQLELIVILKYAFVGISLSIPILYTIKLNNFYFRPYFYVLLYAMLLVVACFSYTYPSLLFPITGAMILLFILSNTKTSFLSFLIILFMITLNAGDFIYIMVFIPAACIIVSLINIEKLNSIILPVIAVNIVSALIYVSIVLTSYDIITPDIYIIPIAGMIVSIIISIIALFTFRRCVLNKYEDDYVSLNDPEFYLLLQLKDKNPEEYANAIHTAYLCDRIADNLGCNRVLAKCLGYYQRIGIVNEGRISENTYKIINEAQFPPLLRKELSEYIKSGYRIPKSCECTILNYSYEVIRTIVAFNKNNPDKKPDYDYIIDKIFEQKYLNNSTISSEMNLKDLDKMKQYMKEEKLYYDFLR